MQYKRKRAGLLKSALLGAATLGAISLAGAGVAQADLVSVGVRVNGGGINTIINQASGANPVSYLGSNSSGSTSGTVYASPFLTEPNFDSSNFSVKNAGGSLTATIYVTEQGVSSPNFPFNMNSGFTTNLVSGSVSSITESTYVDYTNGRYLLGTPNLLATATFNSPYPTTGPLPSAGFVNLISPTGGAFSLTEVYTVTFSGQGKVNNTISMKDVPEPGSLALLGTGLLGLGLIVRRRRRKA